MEFNRDDFNWMDEPIVGMALILYTASIDSFQKPINKDVFYEVGKRKSDGMVIIIPTERNQEHEFINSVMKSTGQLN